MIIIIGDSWGVGEWDRTGLSGPGIGQYLMLHDQVINLSVGAASNSLCLDRLQYLLDRYSVDPYDSIYWIVTCPTRCWRDFSCLIQTEIGLRNQVLLHMHSLFERADQLAGKHNAKINLIGGLCDIDELDVGRYANLQIVIGSWGRLIDESYETDLLAPADWHTLGIAIRTQRPDLFQEWMCMTDRILAKQACQRRLFSKDACHPDRFHHRMLHHHLWPEWKHKL